MPRKSSWRVAAWVATNYRHVCIHSQFSLGRFLSLFRQHQCLINTPSSVRITDSLPVIGVLSLGLISCLWSKQLRWLCRLLILLGGLAGVTKRYEAKSPRYAASPNLSNGMILESFQTISKQSAGNMEFRKQLDISLPWPLTE